MIELPDGIEMEIIAPNGDIGTIEAEPVKRMTQGRYFGKYSFFFRAKQAKAIREFMASHKDE
jgi:hypothetical protein